MKQLLIIILFTLFAFALQIDSPHSFSDVWEQVKSDPLEKLPQAEVSFFKLSSPQGSTILKDANRTLNTHTDILEPFDKLAHPNGICFKGMWKIDTQNIYSGYFKNGSEALIIARASTAMSNTQSGSTRAFGFAGKLFPTTDPLKVNTQPSANFFLIDDLGGTSAKYYRDVELTNEPPVSITFEVIKNMLYGIEVSHAFSQADKNPTIRQLYEISTLGESEKIVTPKWLKIGVIESQKRDAKDFRDELEIENDKKIVFSILVANKLINGKKDWKKIGTITLNSSVVSISCDKRLHFHHPKWKSNLD